MQDHAAREDGRSIYASWVSPRTGMSSGHRGKVEIVVTTRGVRSALFDTLGCISALAEDGTCFGLHL